MNPSRYDEEGRVDRCAVSGGRFLPAVAVVVVPWSASFSTFGATMPLSPLPLSPLPLPPCRVLVAVLSRILFGSLEVESYDVVAGRQAPTSATENVPRTPLEAVPIRRAVVDRDTPSWLLTPSHGNVHAFRAPVACAVFDVLVSEFSRRIMRCFSSSIVCRGSSFALVANRTWWFGNPKPFLCKTCSDIS